MLHYPMPNTKFVFANGGDRTQENIPEMDIVEPNLEFVFGVGGENKMNSSSWILQEWKSPKTERQWGYYRVLHEQGKEVKVKELTVEPGKCLSMQRHQDRAEHWFVSEGTATVYTIDSSTDVDLLGVYQKFDSLHISKTEWHQLCNETDKPLKIVEIQYGENCVEEDIERKI
jgi:mannose-6-phosphate isomerase-like protein (cupin superfamily)